MKLKDFIKVLNNIHHITLYDDSDSKRLFNCDTDSKALLNYADWNVVEVDIKASLIPTIEIIVIIKEGSADNE